MILKAQIFKEHTKQNCWEIVNWVADDPDRFNQLFNLFLNDEYRVSQRAAWPMSLCVIAHPDFIKPYFSALINNLKKPGIHNSIKRNTLRLLQDIEIPAKQEAALMNICFDYILSHKEPVAIKAFSLTVLDNLTKKYPEIIPEIILVIDERMPHETAAFTGRARKLLKKYGR